MTAINTSTQLPTAIDTVEKLAAYSVLALARVNPTLRVLELPGESQFAIEATIIPADDGTDRLIARMSIELDPSWSSDTANPIYLLAKELSNTVLPSGFIQS